MRFATSFALLALVLTAACTNPTLEPSAVSVPVQGVKLLPKVVHISVGETTQLTATIVPSDATDKTVTWESTDPAIASVNAAGLVTAHGEGADVFVTVFTHDGHFQMSANVTVFP